MNAANNKNRPLQMINQTDVRPLTGYFTHDRIAVPNPLPEAPERPERLDVIERNMLALGMDALVRVHYAKPAPIESVILAHDLEYVRRLEAASAGDPAALATFDAPDTRVGPDTFDAAMKSAGAVVEAVDELYAGRIKNAFCGVRPPGHHAARAEARGFCYLNNVAIGAYWAMRRHGARRVAIVDFDAHHGDGTEEIVKNSLPTEDGIQLTVNGGATVKIVDNSKDFIDTRSHWAKDAIDFVSARGLVNGMNDSIYAPNNSTTRAQLWTILARQNDADLTGGNTWFENAQNWAKEKGISDGANPNAAINRAQMVTMLWRAEGQPAAGGTASFTDVSADSYYAQAVAWAIENGITTGVGGGKFDPTGACTRAQIAAFLARSMK